MRRDIWSGTLLIAAAILGILVVSLHPPARDLLTGMAPERQAHLNSMVHPVALAAVPAVFLGLLGLSRRRGPSDLTTTALVVYGFGAVALLSAAVASGLVATPITQRILAAQGPEGEVYHALLVYTGLLNQGFAKVDVVATFAAIALWSVAIVRSGRMARAVGIAGLVGAGVMLGLISGPLRLDVHGFAILTWVQSAWLMWVGILLCREGQQPVGQP